MDDGVHGVILHGEVVILLQEPKQGLEQDIVIIHHLKMEVHTVVDQTLIPIQRLVL